MDRKKLTTNNNRRNLKKENKRLLIANMELVVEIDELKARLIKLEKSNGS